MHPIGNAHVFSVCPSDSPAQDCKAIQSVGRMNNITVGKSYSDVEIDIERCCKYSVPTLKPHESDRPAANNLLVQVKR